MQRYKYGLHKILCVIQICPDKVSLYEKETENDFNWMTAARWAKLESSLWRLFASLTNWKQDAHMLKSELLVDHIQVRIRATDEYLKASKTLLKNEALTSNDLGLEIVLKYMSHEDSTIVSPHAIKRKRVVKSKLTQLENGSDKVNNNSLDTNPRSSEVDNAKKTMLRDNDNEPSTSSKNSSKASRKRNRRSISHDSHRQKDTPVDSKNESTARESLFKSPLPRTNSDELKPERRSVRFSKKPGHYTGFILGFEKKSTKTEPSTRHTARSSTMDSSSDKKATKSKPKEDKIRNKAESSTSTKLKKLDEPIINSEALKKINDMLEVPKPRKVRILLLKDMDEATVLNTFETYREDFDRLYKERQHKFQTMSYMTIDHIHIMDILNKKIRDNMIKKLGELYSKSGAHGSLVINGLLPLWIIRLFMDKFKFTQDEAVRQIADQLKYNTYLKAVNNEPLSSDLED